MCVCLCFSILHPLCLVSQPLRTSFFFFVVARVTGCPDDDPVKSRVRPWRSPFYFSGSRLGWISVASMGKHDYIIRPPPTPRPFTWHNVQVGCTGGGREGRWRGGQVRSWPVRPASRWEVALSSPFIQLLVSVQKSSLEAQMWLGCTGIERDGERKKLTSVSEPDRPSAHYLLTLTVHTVQNWRWKTFLLDQYGPSATAT